MAIKGLEQAVENLSRISKTAVPGAAAMAINRVASSAISQSASQVARETKVRRKLVKERARLKRATVKNPQARIKVNRGDLPVIKLGNARVVLSRRRRRKKGQRYRRPAVFDEADFPAVAVYLTGAEYTGEELDSDTWQAELHIEVFLPAQVPDSELDAWMESRIYPVMSDIDGFLAAKDLMAQGIKL